MIYSESNVNELIKKAKQEERERCAQLAEGWQVAILPEGEDVDWQTATDIARSIGPSIAETIRNQAENIP